MGSTAMTGCGVTVSATRSSTPGASGKTRTFAGRSTVADASCSLVRRAFGRDVEGLDRMTRLERTPDELGTLGHEGAFAPARRALLQEPPQPANPPVREREPLAQEATSATSRAPATSASCEVRTSAANAAGSVTARSASTLRSTWTPAWCRPLMSRL